MAKMSTKSSGRSRRAVELPNCNRQTRLGVCLFSFREEFLCQQIDKHSYEGAGAVDDHVSGAGTASGDEVLVPFVAGGVKNRKNICQSRAMFDNTVFDTI